MNSSIEAVREFIIENFLFGEAGELRDDTSFSRHSVVDSTGILEIILFLEKTFGITIEDGELLPENLDSLENIGRFLERKMVGEER